MIPRLLLSAAILLAGGAAAGAAERNATEGGDNARVVFRPPFTLRVRVDQEHYYEEKKDKVPYVHRGVVYLFIGERFGLKIDVAKGAVRAVRYERDLRKADITLEFAEADPVRGKYTSLLKLQNRTRHTFLIDGAMTVPDRKDILQTSILPLGPGLSNFEAWPHPIVQLALMNIRIQK